MSGITTTASAKATLDGLYKHLPSAVSKLNDIIVTKGQGSWVWSSDGSKYLDMCTGIGVTSTGHCHPKVVKAVQDQAASIVHAQQNVFGAHKPMIELVDALGRIMPSHLTRHFFANSGAEAVDNAIKIARSYTGRQNIITFEGSFHGRTLGTMPLTNSKTIYRQGFGPFMPGVHVCPYPYCLHCKVQECKGHSGYHVAPYMLPFDKPENRSCCNGPLDSLQWIMKQQSAPWETAAIIIEPILGEGGFLVPPPGFLQGLRKLCDEHGILLIMDEVQAGVGRTGKWWGHQQFPDVQPDLLVFAKGIASGYPLAGVSARDDHFKNAQPGTLGGTYGGNAVACAAAVATIQVIEEEKVLDNVNARGIELMTGLMEASKKFPIIDVRGRGLMVGVEFGGKDGTRIPAKGVASAITKACAKRGMLLLTAGSRESVRFLPPLTITADEVEIAVNTFDEACEEAFSKV